MTIIGTAYGVVLNDRAEREALAVELSNPPYLAPPQAPVVYIKPGPCLSFGGAAVPMPVEAPELVVSPTLALLFGHDFGGAGLQAVAASALALDVSLPDGNYYRPDIAQRCRKGFLPLGDFTVPTLPDEIITFVDDVEVHRWSLSRLVRKPAQLIADLSVFMTLRAGDILLIGLPSDAPIVRAGQRVRMIANGLPVLSTRLVAEAA